MRTRKGSIVRLGRENRERRTSETCWRGVDPLALVDITEEMAERRPVKALKNSSICSNSIVRGVLKPELQCASHYGAFVPSLQLQSLSSLGFRSHTKSRSAFFAPGSAASHRSPVRKDPRPSVSHQHWPKDKSSEAWIFRSFNGKVRSRPSRRPRHRSFPTSLERDMRLEDSRSLHSLIICSREVPRRAQSKSQVSVTTQYEDFGTSHEPSFRLLLRKASGDLPLEGWT